MPSLKIAISCPHSTDDQYNRKVLERFSNCLATEEKELFVIRSGSYEAAIRTLDQCHGVLLPGSPADIDPRKYNAARSAHVHPADEARDYTDEILLEHAFRKGKPILGVCHGLQALNVFAGGTLIQGISTKQIDHGISEDNRLVHTVVVEAGTRRFRSFLPATGQRTPFLVNSNHHQAVLSVGRGLRVSARSTDEVIEAVEGVDENHFVMGVQWHPEGLRAGNGARENIFSAFMDAARSRTLRERD